MGRLMDWARIHSMATVVAIKNQVYCELDNMGVVKSVLAEYDIGESECPQDRLTLFDHLHRLKLVESPNAKDQRPSSPPRPPST